MGFPGDSDRKESTYNAKDVDSVPGLERSSGEGNGYPLSILAWGIPWTEKPGRLQSMGSKELDTVECLTLTHLDRTNYTSQSPKGMS